MSCPLMATFVLWRKRITRYMVAACGVKAFEIDVEGVVFWIVKLPECSRRVSCSVTAFEASIGRLRICLRNRQHPTMLGVFEIYSESSSLLHK